MSLTILAQWEKYHLSSGHSGHDRSSVDIEDMEQKNSFRHLSFFAAFLGYSAALFMQDPLLSLNDSFIMRLGIGLLPIAPALYILLLTIRRFQAKDEFQQRIAGEALLYSFCIVGFGSFAYGFLEDSLNLPALPTFYILPLMGGIYGLALMLIRRHYQ